MKSKWIPNAMLGVLAVACLTATAVMVVAVLTRGMPTGNVAHAAQSGPAAGATQPLPVLFKLPSFTLTNQNGRRFGSADLRGKVWVADFMFTRCPGICPMLTQNMKALQDQLQNDPQWAESIRLVSISVDAEHDTPEVLKQYARKVGAQPGQWVFLTGPSEQVWPLSEEGFKLGVGRNQGADAQAMPFNHAPKFVLVDRQGRIRTYHDGTTAQGRAALLADLHRLLDASGRRDQSRR